MKVVPLARKRVEKYTAGCDRGRHVIYEIRGSIRTPPRTGAYGKIRRKAPLCRWRYQELIVDVMSIDDEILGFSNRWYPRAIACAERRSIGGTAFRLVTPVCFVATKLEAFHGRRTDDLAMSHDLGLVRTALKLSGWRTDPRAGPFWFKTGTVKMRSRKMLIGQNLGWRGVWDEFRNWVLSALT